MQVLTERFIECRFPDDWPEVVKLDDSRFYRRLCKACDQTKSVDFVAKGDPLLLLLELKDYRSFAVENRNKLTSGELLSDVTRKVKDTLAVLYAAHRGQPPPDSRLEPACAHLFGGRPGPVQLFLLLEQDGDRKAGLKRDRIALSDFQLELTKRLRTFNVQVRVGDCASTRTLPWSAAALPRPLRTGTD